jgi:MFS family permease
LLQLLCWLPVVFLGVLYWQGILQEYLVYVFICLFTLYTLFSGVVGPPWFSWMGDLVPEQGRGRYFAARNKIAGTAGIVAALIGALVLDFFETKGLALLGFSILFALTFLFRLLSFSYLVKQYAPSFRVKKSSYFSLYSFIKRFDNYGKYSFYRMFFYFAIMFASPFFAVYMLEELNFSYLTFTIITMSSSIFYLIFTPVVGRFSDKFGNLKLLYLSNALFVLSPLCWLFLESPLALLFVPQLVAGLANAAGILASTNFTYDSVKPQHRGICVAYESLFVGVGTFAGSLLGGFLLKYSETFTAFNAFFLIFILAASLRFLVGIIFLPMIKETRKTKKLPAFHLNLAHPFKTIHADIAWFRAITKK